LRARFPARFSAATAIYTCLLQKNFGQKTPGWQDLAINWKFATIRQQIRVELQLRTMIMDAWAGMDNRVSYKKGVPPEMERRIEKYARIGRRLDKLIQKTLDDSKTV